MDFEGGSSNGRIQGCCLVPGRPSCHTAFRSELAGLYGIVAMVKILCETFSIELGAIDARCDGQSALTAIDKHGDIDF